MEKGLFVHKTRRKGLCRILAVLAAFLLCLGLSESGARAAGSYQIRINKQMNCVTIYRLNARGKYEPVKAMVCSTGAATQPGTYSLGEKMRWHVLDGPCYGQYCTRIYGGVLFHSVWYTGPNNPGTLSVYSYNKLGTMASHGCVRLTVADAKWIYDNVPSGTSVTIYNSSDPGPLGKPEAIQVPYSVPWDPTDIWSSGNPWNGKKPSITGAKSQKVDYNCDFDVLKGVKAKNTTGFDATARIKTSITYQGQKVKKVDTRKPGVYKVVYKVVDEIKRKASVTVKIRVTAAKAAPKISGVENLYVKSKDKLTKGYALKNVKVVQNGKELNKKYIQVTYKKLKKKVYKVIYVAQNASEPAKATAKAYIDSTAPKLKGITPGATYPVDSTVAVDEAYAKSLVQVSDNLSDLGKGDIKVKITKQETAEGLYQVVYQVKDQAGNSRKVTIYLQVTAAQPSVQIQGAADMTLSTVTLGLGAAASNEEVQAALSQYLLQSAGVKAYSGEADITASLQVQVTVLSDTSYQAVFAVTDANGNTATQTITVTMVREDVPSPAV